MLDNLLALLVLGGMLAGWAYLMFKFPPEPRFYGEGFYENLEEK